MRPEFVTGESPGARLFRRFEGCGLVHGAERDRTAGVRPGFELGVLLGVDPEQLRDHDRRDGAGDPFDQVELAILELSDHSLRDAARTGTPLFDGARRERVANQLSQAPVARVVHQQHGRLFVRVAPQKLSREGSGVGLARIAPIVGVAQNREDVVVAREDDASELGVAVDGIAFAKQREDRIGIVAKLRVERGELHASR